MMGRHIGKVMKKRGHIYPFMNLVSPFKGAHIVFANLESIPGDSKDKIYFKEKLYNFIAPLSLTTTLKKVGFTVFNLSNNHAMDYGVNPISKTRRALAKDGIASFGAGKDLKEARAPSLINIKGVTFGFLGYSNGHSRRIYATEKRGGVVPYEMKLMKEDIKSLKEKAQVVVISLHWGIEYEHYPSEEQVEMARELIDAGADLILGHHPHVMQGIEIYKGKLIAYSMGNFLFDQKHGDTGNSFMLSLKFSGRHLKKVRVEPLDRFKSYFPRRASGARRGEILASLRKMSLPLNANPSVLPSMGL